MSAGLRSAWLLVFWVTAGIASFVLGVLSPLGQQAEAIVLDAAEFTTDPPAPLNLVSIWSILVTGIAIAAVAYFAHGLRRAITVAVVPAIAIGVSQLLKQQVLQRPDLFEFDAPNTFPSGHMTVFTVFVVALLWALPDRWRSVVMLGGTALLAIAGWQLLEYGWHRPSDVFGALALGLAAFCAASLLPRMRQQRPTRIESGVARALATAGWALLAAALVMALWAGVQGRDDLMLLAGQLGVIGASAVAIRSGFLAGAGPR